VAGSGERNPIRGVESQQSIRWVWAIHSGGIATRYDKYPLTFHGGVLLATSVMRARTTTQKLGDTPARSGCGV
jgi:hypothetical protein